ncbi:MAG: hypothetical protein ABIA63_11315, partial [bacterium]
NTTIVVTNHWSDSQFILPPGLMGFIDSGGYPQEAFSRLASIPLDTSFSALTMPRQWLNPDNVIRVLGKNIVKIYFIDAFYTRHTQSFQWQQFTSNINGGKGYFVSAVMDSAVFYFNAQLGLPLYIYSDSKIPETLRHLTFEQSRNYEKEMKDKMR